MSGFLHFTNVTINHNKIIAPTRQIVKDKAYPTVHTKSPSVQNFKKLGMNWAQLSCKWLANVLWETANIIQYNTVYCMWSKYLKCSLNKNTFGMSKASPIIENASPIGVYASYMKPIELWQFQYFNLINYSWICFPIQF